MNNNELNNIHAKIDKLLSVMTIAQKVGQMTQVERMTCTPDDVKKYHLGSVLSGGGSGPEHNNPQDWVDMIDSYWCSSMEIDEDHLALPIIYGADAVHGNSNVKGATVFPHNIGLGAANDENLMYRIAQVTAKEVLATGIDLAFAPNLAVAKDYHWGRTYESYAQTPEIINKYAPSIIAGMQSGIVNDSVFCCIKHWVGDGGTTHGINHGDTVLTWEELNKIHITPFVEAINAGALIVMASFSSWNGDKCHGHKFLIDDVLKNKIKFSGFVLSDMDGIDYLSNDFYKAVGLGVNAGIDMFMIPQNWKEFIEHLISHVELGSVSMSKIDDSVRRILYVKFAMQLFDKPRPKERQWANDPSFGSKEHKEVAREAVRKSLVLLKNNHNALPLNKQNRFLVCGKNADNIGHQCGGFTIDWQGISGNDSFPNGTSIWQGIQRTSPNSELFTSVESITQNQTQFDAAIVVIGEKPYAEGIGDIREDNEVIMETGSMVNGEISISEPYGNSIELQHLHPEDLQVIQALTAKNIPVIAVLISGRPLVINEELKLCDAFVAAWLPGTEGQGVSDVLFGDHNLHGKLSFSWPARNHLKTTTNSQCPPLLSFGFGLTY
ncbi:glycoside hydrolase family 3 protein [Colwelliaceae bacterium BS250]